MIRLKHIDFYGQVAVLLFFLVLGCTVSENWLMGAYFMIGGWQIISCIIHRIFLDKLLIAESRSAYEKLLVFVLLAGACCCIIPVLLYFYLIMLLVLGIAMAFWYGAITYKEMRVWEARAFVHLK